MSVSGWTLTPCDGLQWSHHVEHRSRCPPHPDLGPDAAALGVPTSDALGLVVPTLDQCRTILDEQVTVDELRASCACGRPSWRSRSLSIP